MSTLSRIFKKFARSLGPGLVTGASDDDPSGIATYARAGAQFGLGALWTALFTFPFMAAVQEMCGRIGIVKGKGLSEVIKEHYGSGVLTFAVALLVIANTVTIGANLGAMASAMRLLFEAAPFTWWLILLATLTIVLEVFVPYRTYVRYLKYLALALFAYIATGILVTTSWDAVIAHALLPRFIATREYLMAIVAILGATISPYLFFWQTSEEVEEEVAHHKLREMDHGAPHLGRGDIRAMRLDTAVGMAFSNIIMLFIILTAAGTLHAQGLFAIGSAADAAEMLRPFAGTFTFVLFALGIVGTGLLAVPVLAGSASYALSEALGWRAGLYRKPSRAPGFYAVISAAIVIGLFINLVSSVEPFRMLYYAAILNGVIAPPLLFLILAISNNPRIMGRHVNSALSNALGYTIAVVMAIAAIALVALMF